MFTFTKWIQLCESVMAAYFQLDSLDDHLPLFIAEDSFFTMDWEYWNCLVYSCSLEPSSDPEGYLGLLAVIYTILIIRHQ